MSLQLLQRHFVNLGSDSGDVGFEIKHQETCAYGLNFVGAQVGCVPTGLLQVFEGECVRWTGYGLGGI